MTTRFLRTFILLGLLSILISGCGRLAEIAQGNDLFPNQPVGATPAPQPVPAPGPATR